MTDAKPSEREAFECRALNQRMAGLLNRIAAVIKGDPGPHRFHSWHDLPDLAAQAMQAARATQPAQQEQDRIDAERYRWLRKGAVEDVAVVRGLGATDYGMSAVVSTYSEEIDGDDLDAAIDAARKGGSNG